MPKDTDDLGGSLAKIVNEMARIGANLLEDRITHAMQLAGITSDDVKAGRAWVIKAVDNHDLCGRSGVVREWDSGKSVMTVQLCPCLEIRIAKRITS